MKKISKKNSNLIDDKPLFFKNNRTVDKLDATCSMSESGPVVLLKVRWRGGGIYSRRNSTSFGVLTFLKGN